MIYGGGFVIEILFLSCNLVVSLLFCDLNLLDYF